MLQFYENLANEFRLPLANPVLVFSLVLFIILLSPILLKRINIPGTVGLILSGVIVGPHGLNLMEKNSAVDLFSTIGLLYIMFIAGLELDMNEFNKNKHRSILFGILTFTIPISIGFPVCYYLLNYGLNASFLTASMFATHTLVAYPIVSKMGISKNQAVAITVGGTILTDTAVLIILAIVMGHSQGTLDQDFWIRLGISLTIFSAIIFLLIPVIARWFFRKLESEKHSHYIFVLSIVFFSAFLAKVAGIEPIVGAFAAGLALNRLIPNSSALMNRIEFIGNSLFIPFFLISVGMLVDVRVIFNGPMALIIAATLTIVALFGKWVAALFTQLIFRYSAAQRQLIFGLSSSHAAATIAVILVGYQARILDANILNGTIILILITCIVASFAAERASKKIVVSTEHENGETSSDKEFSDELILLPISDTADMEKLLEFSVLIKEKNSTNPITVLSVVPNDEEAESNVQKARKQLQPIVNYAAAYEAKVHVIATIDLNVCSGIGRTAKEIMSDIIIFGWPQKQGFIDRVINDKTESIVNCTTKTTFVCHFIKPLATHKRIILICPLLAEKEKGFSHWLSKLSKISQELSIPITCYCDKKTKTAFQLAMKKNQSGISILFEIFRDTEDFLALSRFIKDDDMLIFVSSRPESVSYKNYFEQVPLKLEKYYENNSKIIIYPRQYDTPIILEGYDDVVTKPISLGIETVQKIGKGIENIFRKKEP
jgi:Kef-type K+ transport system membrane component KefB